MPWPEFALAVVSAVFSAGAVYLWARSRLRSVSEAAEARVGRLQNEQQAALARLETQQQTLFNSMAEGVLVLDEAQRIILANPAFGALFGISGDVCGKTLIEAVRLHELTALLAALGPDRERSGQALKLTRPLERWLQVSAAAVFDRAKQRRGTVLVFHDLTRMKRLENARKDFVANVSHELRTPLSLIRGYVETLVDGAYEDSDLCLKFLKTIERNTDRLQLLIEDLLAISEIESGCASLDLQPTPVRPLAQKVIEDFKPLAAARRVELRNECAELSVRADARRFEQVLGNLVDNAIKYGKEQGVVLIGAAACAQDTVEICVRDDGPGIPPEALDRVFERFFRVDKARSRDQGGTGLGLSIVKHLVQSHGGRAWAESELGKGATFRFTLPAANPEVS